MNTTEELLETTEVQTEAALTDGEMEIPKDYFSDISDADFIDVDAEENTDIFP